MADIKRLLGMSGKNIRPWYFLRHVGFKMVPKAHRRALLQRILRHPQCQDREDLQARIDYYCALSAPEALTQTTRIRDLRWHEDNYTRDFMEYGRLFNPELCVDTLFGDVREVPSTPAIVKSRPVQAGLCTANSVVLNLDKVRHFVFLKDPKPFTEKKPLAICRGSVFQENRERFMKMYFGHPRVDCGDTAKHSRHPEWKKPPISFYAHLDYQFILSLEGNDVATNLKWIMSSNSLAVMPKPTCETWFMEGQLQAGVHYVEIAPDFSDLLEKMDYYTAHPDEAQAIIRNAHAHVARFQSPIEEDYVSVQVLKKYFIHTNNIEESELFLP